MGHQTTEAKLSVGMALVPLNNVKPVLQSNFRYSLRPDPDLTLQL